MSSGPAPPAEGGAALRLRAAAALLLLAFFALESWHGALRDAQTSDEAVTIASGYAFLRTGRVLINAEHPMLAKALLAIPLLALPLDFDPLGDAWKQANQYVAGHELLWENHVSGLTILRAARLPAVVLSTALVALVFLTAARLYGAPAGLLALGLAAGSPDLLGHGHLALLDVPLALAGSLALLAFLAYAARPGRRRLLLLALALGAMLAVKISALQLLPALGLAALVRALVDPDVAARGTVRVPAILARHPRGAALYVLEGGLAVAAALGALLLAASYLGSPRPYLEGLERNALLAGYGHPTWLLGEVSLHGFRSYFLVALALKLPLVTLAVLALAAATAPVLRLGRSRTELTALAFAVAVIALASFGPAQTGVRYVFPAYPVLFVLGSRIAAWPFRREAARTALVAVVAIASLGFALASRPHLSSMNALAGGPATRLRSLADSNLDWGQDLGRLAVWLRARGSPTVRLALFSNASPEAYGIRVYQPLPAAGPVLPPRPVFLGAGDDAGAGDSVCVSGNNLLGLFFDRDYYGWLRAREPLAVVGGSIWVYDLGGRRADHLELARTYREARWTRFALHEEGLAREATR